MSEDQIDWAAVRADYEARDKSVRQIEAEYGLSEGRLYHRCEVDGWRRRRPTRIGSRTTLIARLYRLLQRQITELEMKTSDFGDKEVAILGQLTRNLEKLAELDRKENSAEKTKAKRGDIAVLRKKLAERIDRLIAD